jgi:hypothetical protein
MSQLDFKAGTRGAGACILSGRDKLANPVTKRATGVLIDPTKLICARFSIINVIKVIPQARNNSDSYKLLKGK